ncbi:MAG TPA: efflux RND transporter periplasmic adaptor subunit [Verrucomicrobiae bacterium]|nr:efflux RND transporter periplasmic adaptor subunit [Verrucomicrobiae bacterium]
MGTPKAKNKKRGRIVLVTAIVLTVGAVGAFLGFKRREVAVAVQTDKVVRRDITELVVANGRIQPVVQVVINPEVSGEIIDLPVKEGQMVKKGDLLVRIKPDNYIAQRNSAEANYKSSLAGQALAKANLEKARLEFGRFEQLFNTKLISDSQYLESKTLLDVAKANFDSSTHQIEQTKATLARAEDDLSKTTIKAPIEGTVTKLRSQRGERVVGTAMMAGTEIMTIADLEAMEARVDIGEIDVVLIALGQKAHLEVEAFRNKKFNGVVTEIANAARGAASSSQQQQQSSQQQEATKFEVKVLITEKDQFRPGMSVTAEIETRSKTNVLAVPIMAVTTRTGPVGDKGKKPETKEPVGLIVKAAKKEEPKAANEIVFLINGETVKTAKVKTGISDDTFIEVTDGVTEGQEIVSGGYAAVSRQLEEGKKIKKEDPNARKKALEDKKV